MSQNERLMNDNVSGTRFERLLLGGFGNDGEGVTA
jgi:hypothetical protein